MIKYSFLQEVDNSIQYNLINEGVLRNVLKFKTICKKAEILRERKHTEWIKKIKELRFLLKNKKIDQNTYKMELGKIYDSMSRLELRLSNLNVLPLYH